MKCRQIVKDTDGYHLVYFGKIVKGDNQTLYCSNNLTCSDMLRVQDSTIEIKSSYINYVDKQDAVVSSLIQKLSILKGELWYSITTGIPLFDKFTNKALIDSYIASTIMSHSDVKHIKSFTSNLEKHTYHCSFTVMTIYGDLDISV